MAQKIDFYFGFQLRLDRDFDEREFKDFKEALANRLKELGEDYVKGVRVYIHKLEIFPRPRHLQTDAKDRLSRLDVSLLVNKKVREQKLMWFINSELDLKLNPDAKVEAGRYKISYSLSGEFCCESGHYADYIATIVDDRCRDSHRKLTVTATAHATDEYRRKLKNSTGRATTSLIFPLDRDVQLTLGLQDFR